MPGTGLLATIGAKLLGGGAEGIVNGIAKVIDAGDEYFHTKEEKAALNIVREKMLQNEKDWQNKINLAEAGHRSIFIAGWRPAIGWICAIALLWGWIVGPLVQYVCNLFGHDVAMPAIEIGQAISLTLAMLGMGTLRTLEKATGITK